MKLFTNKFPVLQHCVCIHPDGTVNDDAIKTLFEEGKIFKVIGIDQMVVILLCEGKHVPVSADLFNTAFVETEITL